MLARRQFLISTLAAAATPQLAVGLERLGRAETYVIAEMCGAGRHFAECANGKTKPALADPNALLFDLEDQVSRGAVDRIIGLSRPSTKFLIEQVAAAHGFTTHYHGSHRLEASALRHEFFAPPELLTSLNTISASPTWAGDVARLLQHYEPSSGTSTMSVRRSLANDVSQELRHLSSFLLVRK